MSVGSLGLVASEKWTDTYLLLLKKMHLNTACNILGSLVYEHLMYIGSSIICAEDFLIWNIVYFGYAIALVSYWVYPKSDINKCLPYKQEHCNAPLRYFMSNTASVFPNIHFYQIPRLFLNEWWGSPGNVSILFVCVIALMVTSWWVQVNRISKSASFTSRCCILSST